MDPIIKSLYLFFYGKPRVLKYIKNSIPPKVALERLFRTNGSREFIEKYIKFGSQLYFRLLEIKSKEAREEWGREAVHHSRDVKNVRRNK